MSTDESALRPLVILNPVANAGKIQAYRALVQQYLAGVQGEYRETTRSGEARLWAEEAARAERGIVIVGGDGTVHEAANGILASGKRVPLGIVAAGSGNDYAVRTLKLPTDPQKALEQAFHGKVQQIDVGEANGRHFVNSFSVGLDADIADRANQLKRYPFLRGGQLYYVASLQQLLFAYQRCPWLSFDVDEVSEQEQRYILLAVTLGPAYGGGFRINPEADPADGLLDVCTIRYAPLLRAFRLLPVVQQGKHASLPEVTFYRASSLTIESRAPVRMELDGEVAQASHFAVRVLPGALSIRIEPA